MYSPQIDDQPKPTASHFRSAKKYDRKKVPSSGSHAIGALERKFQETLGQIKRLDDAEYEWEGREGFELAEKYEADLRARLRAALVSLENSIRLLCPTWDRKHYMAPRIKQQTRPLLPRTVFQHALVSCLRRAAVPLAVSEIVEIVASEVGLPNPTTDQRRRLRCMAYNSLRRSYDKGFVECIGKPAKWRARSNQADGNMVER